MRLTQILCKYKPEFMGYLPKIRGHAYIGKRRFVPPVTSNAKYFVMRQIMYEEETMKILSRPYITAKQEQAYLQSIGRTHPEHYDEFMHKKIVRPEQQYYAADVLRRLDVSRAFDEID